MPGVNRGFLTIDNKTARQLGLYSFADPTPAF